MKGVEGGEGGEPGVKQYTHNTQVITHSVYTQYVHTQYVHKVEYGVKKLTQVCVRLHRLQVIQQVRVVKNI